MYISFSVRIAYSRAMAREYAIKQLSRQEKAQLIKAGSLRSKTVPNNKEHDSQ